jgi:hypothetical protein
MKNDSGSLTARLIIENAEYSAGSPSHHWKAWIRENIVLLVVSGNWPAEQYPHYFRNFWEIYCERKKFWNKVYLLFDTNNLPIQSEEFRGYIRENWAHLLDREDFCLCIVESSSMKRTIWKSVHRLLNVQSKIHLFENYTSALHWIQENRPVSSSSSNELRDVTTIPEELNLDWITKHAHIKLAGKDLIWSIIACRNIIILTIRNHWTPKTVKDYMEHISGLPSLLLEKWNDIYLIFDVTLMDFDIKDAPRFLRSNWLKFLDRDDMTTCMVHRKKLSRFLWKQLLWQIGKLNEVKVFPDCDAALTWIRSRTITCVQDWR